MDGKQLILIIEDDKSLAAGLCRALQSEEIEAVSCGTLKAAANLLYRQQESGRSFALALLDVNLPDGSGLDFIEWLRGHLDAYIICLTALNQEMDQVLGYEAGADDYITKPFSLSVLLLKIEAFFKRSAKEGAAGILYSGALRFNQGEMKLSIDDLEVSLSKNEWRLLGLFLNHPKQILSKRQILEHVFDMEGEFVDENTLNVHIRKIREAIEEEPGNPGYVVTVWGDGYKFTGAKA